MITKTCSTCKQDLPATEEYFNKHKLCKYGLQNICRKCTHEYGKSEEAKEARKQRRQQNIEEKREYDRSYYHENKERILARAANPKDQMVRHIGWIRREYNTTEKKVMELMDMQKGCCGICGKSLVDPDSEKRYSIDHNHKTGKVRGLLCSHCNQGIGHFFEDKSLFLKATDYLEKHSG